jgi:hypothetical protein
VALVGLAALAFLAEPASAQYRTAASAPFFRTARMPSLVGLQSSIAWNRPGNYYLPNGLTLNQYATTVATLGNAASFIPPYMLGYNPYPQNVNFGPSFPTFAGGYGLSTAGGYGGGLAAGGYGGGLGGYGTLSTAPYGGYGLSTYGGGGYGGGGYYPPYGGDGFPPEAAFLYGEAAVYNAIGKYYQDIQQAKLTQEQARQAQLDTRRKRMELELEYERNRPTYHTMVERTRASELREAREAPATDVWSGRALNTLLAHIKRSHRRLRTGPKIRLHKEVLKHIHVKHPASRGHLGLLRHGGRLDWPEVLRERRFDRERIRLEKNIKSVVRSLKDKDPVERSLLADLRADLRALIESLNASVGDLSPSQYILAKRYLNLVTAAVLALSDRRVVRYFDGLKFAPAALGGGRGEDDEGDEEEGPSYPRTVAELVAAMEEEGLEFAPAAPGDEAAYTSLYQAMRAFDAGLQVASKGEKVEAGEEEDEPSP